MESHRTGFPPLALLLEIPSGLHIPTASTTGSIFQDSCKTDRSVGTLNPARGL